MATNGEVRCKKYGPKYVGPTSLSSTLTMLITKRLFWMLMQEAKVDEDLLQFFVVDLGSISEAERTIVKKASASICDIINSSDQARVEYSVEDFKGRQWHIHSTNVHTEFNKVVKVTLGDEVHWGRVIGFLSFAVGYAVYVHRIGMPNSTVESIHGWTVQVLEHGIKDFFTQSGGWEGFLDYAEVLLKRLRRKKTSENGREQESFWSSAVAIGVIGVGAAAAYTLRHALS